MKCPTTLGKYRNSNFEQIIYQSHSFANHQIKLNEISLNFVYGSPERVGCQNWIGSSLVTIDSANNFHL